MTTKKILFITVFIMAFSTKTLADIYTPVVLNMTSKQLNEVLNSSFKEGLVLESELKELPQISGLDFVAESIRYTAKFVPYFEILDDGQVRLDVKIKDIEFKVTHFDAKYKLVQNQGSLRVNVYTSITCDELKIRGAKDVGIEAFGSIKGDRPWVGDINFVAEPDFIIDAQNCEAPGNYQDKLSEIAIKWLVSDEGQTQIINLVNREVIQSYWDDFKKGLEFSFLGRKIYISLIDLKVGSRVQARTQIRWPYKEQILLNTHYPNQENILTYTISDLKKILKLWIPKECFQIAYSRSEIPGANDLFESRFMQFLAWRDLMSFPTDVDFKLHVAICIDNLDINHALTNGVKFNHKAILLVQLNLVINNKELPYVVAYGSGQGELSVVSTQNGVGLHLEKSKFEMQSRFHSQMKKWRGDKKYSGEPSMSMIFPRVVSALEAGPLPVAKELSPLLKNMKFGSGDGLLYFDK